MEKTAAVKAPLPNDLTTQLRQPRAGGKEDSVFAMMIAEDGRAKYDNKDSAVAEARDKAPEKDNPVKAKRVAKDDKSDAPDRAEPRKSDKADKSAKAEKAERAEPVAKAKKKADEPVDDANPPADLANPADAPQQADDVQITVLNADAEAIQSAAISIEDLLADIAAAIPVMMVGDETTAPTTTPVEGDALLTAATPKLATAQALLPVAGTDDGLPIEGDIAVAGKVATPELTALAEAVPADAAQPDQDFQKFIADKIEQLQKVATDKQPEAPKIVADTPPVIEAAPQEVAKPKTAASQSAQALSVIDANANQQPAPVALQAVAQAAPQAIHAAVGTEKTDSKANTQINITPAAVNAEALKATLPYEQKTQLARAQQISQPQIVEQVAVKMNLAAKNGDKSFSIQLHPAELGRIEVKLDVTQNGQARATITADNNATLDLMQKDRGSLERALSDAGLKLDSGSLNFNLREGNQQQSAFNQMAQNQQNGRTQPLKVGRAEEELPTQILNVSIGTDLASGRVDIRA